MSWDAYWRRNDCIEVYYRNLHGIRARAYNWVSRYASPIRRRYHEWLGAEVLWNERTVEYFAATRMLPAAPCHVLDVGSASSRWPIQLASSGYDVSALDVRDFGYEHPRVEFVRAGVHEFKPPWSFECITAISVVEHFGLGHYGDDRVQHGDRTAVALFREWLARGGVLILSVPFGLAGQTAKHRIYDAASLEPLRAGFEVEDDRYYRRHGEFWLPSTPEELAGVPSPGLPVNGVVIRKLRRSE